MSSYELWCIDNSPLNQSFHPINMALKVPLGLNSQEGPGGAAFHVCTVVFSVRWDTGSLEYRIVQLTGSFDRVSLLGVTGNSRTSELLWVALPEPLQPFAVLAMGKGSSNCCSSPNLFNASVTLSPSSLSEVALKMSTVNPEKTMC